MRWEPCGLLVHERTRHPRQNIQANQGFVCVAVRSCYSGLTENCKSMAMRYGRVGSSSAKPQVGLHALGAVRVARSRASEQDTKGEIFKRIKVLPSKDFRSPPNPPKSPRKTSDPLKSSKDPQSPQKTSDPLKILRRLPIPNPLKPSKHFRSPQNPPNPAAPSRPRMITSRRRNPLFFFFGPPTRPTTHTPHNTRSRGVKNRGAPDQNHRFATSEGRKQRFSGQNP